MSTEAPPDGHDKNDHHDAQEIVTKNSGVDPSEVLKQVLGRVAQSPKLAQDISQDKKLKDALKNVLNAQCIHQILAMDSQAARCRRQCRIDREEQFLNRSSDDGFFDYEEDEDENDDDTSSPYYQEEDYHWDYPSATTTTSDSAPAPPLLLNKEEDDEEETILLQRRKSPILSNDDEFAVGSFSSSVPYGSSYGSSSSTTPLSIWPQNPTDFAFSQEHKDHVDEEEEEELFQESLEVLDIRVYRQVRHTGFEPTKDFDDRINTVVAGRYVISRRIGEAAFSTTYECQDTAEPHNKRVCLKVIKNNKDFFDQGLDEIQILSYLQTNLSNTDYIVTLLDYFYYKEHLILVMELLGPNLYDYGRALRKAGNASFFTISRIRQVMRQSLMALEAVHALDLIHCDVKLENIVLTNIEEVGVKLIDFGSSCFTSDFLSSYVQSRSYRAPEVLLGLEYGTKIDLWSLGCVAAELFTGRVLFSNESIATLLVRIIAIVGEIPTKMLAAGRDVPKYFNENFQIFTEGGKVLSQPRRSSIKKKLRIVEDTDESLLFVDFVTQLLQIDPEVRLDATEAQNHPFILQY